MPRNRKSRRSGQIQSRRLVCRPSLESFEKRELLATVSPFIQGTAFIDSSADGIRSTTELPLPGATIGLYNGSTLVASTTTGTDGGYLFNSSNVTGGLSVGTTYKLIESATGYTNTGAQALSSIDPASVISANTIQVTVVDPNAVTASFANPVSYGSPPYDRVTYKLNGVADTIVPTQLTFTLAGAPNVNTASFPTLCVGVNDRLGFNTPFASVIDPQSSLTNGGQIAYLFNHYGSTLPTPASLPSGLQSISAKNLAAGVQLAIWELEYGSSFALTGYDTTYTSAQDYADLQTAAAGFIADAAGKSEKVAIIDASLTGSLPSPGVTPGGQSVLASESLNFGNIASVKNSLSGVVYVDATGVGLTGPLNSPPPVNPANPTYVDTVEPGVTVSLYVAGSTTAIATTTTNSSGAYSFTNLPNGTYTVQETTPGGYVETYPTSTSYTVPLSGGQNVPNNNFSNFMSSCNAASLTNVVYKDNGSVIPGLRGYTHQGDTVTVTFTVPSNVPSETLSLVAYSAPGSSFNSSTASQQSIVSLQTGTYGPGTYTETVTIPNSYYQIDFVCGAPITQFGPANSNIFYGAQGRLIDADNGGTQTYALSSLSGTVYADNNGNDKLDGGETGLGGITVYLANATGTAVLATTTTAANGTYTFNNLAPGTYIVAEIPPSGYTGETSNPGSIGGSGTYTPSSMIEATTSIGLNSNTAATSYNFGQFKPGALTGTVFADNNGNGTFGTGDKVLPGVSVTLNGTTGAGVAVSVTTTTDSNGNYSFSGIAPGLYQVAETTPTGYSPEAGNVGTAGGNSRVGIIDWIWVNSGTSGASYNLGNLGSSISGTVYVDASGSGLTSANVPAANSGDTPEAGVTVKLTNSSGVVIATTTTAADGTYSFTGVPYGSYTVSEAIPAGTYQTGPNSVTYSITTSAASPNSTNDNFANYMACNSSGLTNVKYFVNGVQVPTLGGYTSQGATVTVTFDNTGTAPIMLSLASYEAAFPYFTIYNVSQQVLVGDSTVTLAPGKSGSLTVTLPNSYYQVDFVCGAAIVHFGPGGSNVDYGEEGRFINGTIGGNNAYATSTLSGVAFVDNNGNGTYGSGDTLLPNVPVTLTGTTYVGANLVGTTLTPVTVTYTTTTSSTGAYSFAGLAPGTYTVTETVPSGYFAETANVGTVGGSSVVASVTSIALNSNTAATGYNFGVAKPSSISGTVYADNNGNSNLDCYDAGLGGVTVYLYNAAGTVQLASTTTASNGSYTFGNLAPGTYQVTTFAPSGYTGETPDAGTSGGNASYNSSTKLASISSITLGSNTNATGYTFGEKANSTGLGCYQTGSTNYWCGSAGQSLINCVNGGSGAKNLGNWLSSILPNICGSYAGKTNAQICSSFQSLCWTNSCNANIVATALAAYCTSSDLAGCTSASNCGFQMVTGGSGNCTISVGNQFSGYGGPCGTASLFQLLSFADSQSTSWSSWSWWWGSSSQSSISSCFSSINNCSKIG